MLAYTLPAINLSLVFPTVTLPYSSFILHYCLGTMGSLYKVKLLCMQGKICPLGSCRFLNAIKVMELGTILWTRIK